MRKHHSKAFGKILKLFTVGLIILALMFVWGCRTYDGCWKGKEPKYNNKKFNK